RPLAGRDDLRLMSEIFTYVALASLWNLLAGYAGLVSVGQQAYVGLGGYVLFAATILAGMHPLSAVPLAGVIAAAIALPVAGLSSPRAPRASMSGASSSRSISPLRSAPP